MPTFVSGVELSRAFHQDLVAPLLAQEYPGLEYAAALIGSGSEVLGYDTERSTDHAWGPRLLLFLQPQDYANLSGELWDLLDNRLPAKYRGIDVRYPFPRFGAPVQHQVGVVELRDFLRGAYGIEPGPEYALATEQWLTLPTQNLLEACAGAVFHDGPGELTSARDALAWYPDQVWRYVLACQWTRIAEEEAFVGRCGEVGDELGSAVVAARLARDVMRLSLLMSRRYPPYSKWLGSAFARLPWTSVVAGSLGAALAATHWTGREEALCRAYTAVAERFNELELTEPVSPQARLYHDRPFHVLGASRFADALKATLTDPHLRSLPPVGAVDQFADNVHVLADTATRRRYLAAGAGATTS